jgi:hypothetical protein
MRDAVESPRDDDLAASAPPLIDLFFEGLRRNPPRTAPGGGGSRTRPRVRKTATRHGAA